MRLTVYITSKKLCSLQQAYGYATNVNIYTVYRHAGEMTAPANTNSTFWAKIHHIHTFHNLRNLFGKDKIPKLPFDVAQKVHPVNFQCLGEKKPVMG